MKFLKYLGKETAQIAIVTSINSYEYFEKQKFSVLCSFSFCSKMKIENSRLPVG